jgi:hypothetical protein
MLGLHELQFRFAAALFGDSAESITPWIVAGGLDPEARVRVYRNNVRIGFAKALALAFPVIERLVGAEYFEQLAREFQADHPSRCGNLHFIGAPFSGFVRRRMRGSGYEYLADVAAVEWACQEVAVAAEASPLSVRQLEAIAPEDYALLRFRTHPACRLVRTGYPVVRIWQANQPEYSGTEQIHLDANADLVLVRRMGHYLELNALPRGEFELLAALEDGMTLGEALEVAAAAQSDFDLGRALRHALTLGVFIDITTHRFPFTGATP